MNDVLRIAHPEVGNPDIHRPNDYRLHNSLPTLNPGANKAYLVPEPNNQPIFHLFVLQNHLNSSWYDPVRTSVAKLGKRAISQGTSKEEVKL